jgi:hypothetical protein
VAFAGFAFFAAFPAVPAFPAFPTFVRVAVFFEAAVDVPRAVRLAMVESFRNLDSITISVVLSDAYRKSDGAAEPLLVTEIAGRRTPLPERRQSNGCPPDAPGLPFDE